MNQEERIEYLMAEIARLSNQVVDLQDERDALADAGRGGFIAGYFHYKNYGFQFEEELEAASNQYHASILAGKE